MKLSKKEIGSELWVKLKKEHVAARMQELREQNDSDLSVEETARVRGRIAELKELLTLEDPEPVVEELPPD